MNVDFKIDEIHLTEHSIKKINLSLNIEKDSNLRDGRIVKDIKITGVINPEILESGPREVDDAREIVNFALIPEYEDCYKDITYSLNNSAGKNLVSGDLKDSYVVSYEEEFSNDKGVGEFSAVFREMLVQSSPSVNIQPMPSDFLIKSDSLFIELPFERLTEEALANAGIEIGDILEYILTPEQQRRLRNLIRNGANTDNFFDSLSIAEQRQLQFLDSSMLSNLNDSNRLALLKYLNENRASNGISHDFLRSLGIIPDGYNRRQIELNFEVPLFLEYIAITQSGNDLAHHDRVLAERRLNELFAAIGAVSIPRAGGKRQPQRGQGGNQSNSPPRRVTVDDLINSSTPGRTTRGRTTQFERRGSFQDAQRDFDRLHPSNIQNINTKWGPGRTGILSDGRKITVRPGSTLPGNPSTLEIQSETIPRVIKIRYIQIN